MVNKPRVLILHSFKGGVGKTWLALNLARCIRQEGKKVLLIEADFSMPTYAHIFPNLNVDVYFNQYLDSGNNPIKNFIYKNSDTDFDIICCSPNFKASDQIFSNNQSWFLERIKLLERDVNQLDYDYIIFDMTPGFTLFLVNVLTITNHTFVLSRSDVTSTKGTEYLIDRVYSKLNIKADFKLHIILNQIPRMDKFEELIQTISNQYSVKFPFINSITSLYLDEEIIYLSAINKYFLPEDSLTVNDFKEMVDKNLFEKSKVSV